jgi:hypothetical protein
MAQPYGPPAQSGADVRVDGGDGLFWFTPMNDRGRDWMMSNLDWLEWQWLQGGVVVDGHHYAEAIVEEMANDGLIVEGY